jgi:DNA-binding MurR/RpiR family transcriptional regulator
MSAREKITVLEQLRRDLPRLSGREARAARHLLANYPMAGLTTVAEFAAQSGVSTATVLRLVRRLGFPVYADFQSALRRHLEDTLQSPLLRFGEREDLGRSTSDAFFDHFMEAMLDHIEALRSNVSAAEFEKVAVLLADPRRDIHILGGRYSSNLAAYVAGLMMAIRGRVFTISGQTQQWPQHLLDLGKSSVLLVYDVRRYQQDVVVFAQAAARRGATVVLLTDIWQSPAARVADHVLTFQVESPSIFDVLTIGMALSEALVGAVANRLGSASKGRIETLEELRRPFAPQEAGLDTTQTPSGRGRR